MYKSKLQELCQQYAWSLPEYVTIKDGPDYISPFSTSITVNGFLFQTPSNQFRSSKESQNEAAKIAFEYFTAHKPILQQSINPTPVHPKAPINSSLSGFISSTAILDTKAAKIGLAEQENSQTLQAVETPSSFEEDKSCKDFRASTVILDTKAAKIGLVEQENSQTLKAVETPLSFEEDKSCKEMLHLYKSRLQNYAQKRNLTRPTYSCEITGPPHARHFKSKVTVDGKSYETSNFFTNLKDAEHAAAKVAFESMSLHETQEDEGVYKSLLQGIAQKGGFCNPAYETHKSGPPHMLTFVSKVEIGGESFEGQKAKSKKLAEMSAAKAACNGLTERRAKQYSTVSLNLQPYILDNVQPNVIEKVEPKVVLEINSSIEEQAQEVKKTYINGETPRKSSSSENEYAQLQGPTSTFSPPKDGLSLSSPSTARSDIEISAGAQSSATKRILVCARTPHLAIPDGATILPISDN